jgi:hypothetical protein
MEAQQRILQDYRDIGDNARQQAIYEAHKALMQTSPLMAAETVSEPVSLGLEHDIPSLLASSLKSALVLGAPRAGKGYAIAKSLELLPSNVQVWLIDPKNDPGESHYWARIPAERRVRFDVTKLDRAAVTSCVMELFERFLLAPNSAQRPKLLIIDECSPGLRMGMIAKSYGEMLGRVATIASVGPSQGSFVWLISQATTTDDVGLSRANRASLRLLAVAHAQKTERSWLESVKATIKADMPAPSLQGYIQMLDGHWAAARPFELSATAPVQPQPESPRTPQHERHSAYVPEPAYRPAMAAQASAEAILRVPVGAHMPDAQQALLKHLRQYSDARSLRQLCQASFAKRHSCTSTEAMLRVLEPLVDAQLVGLAPGGYVAL